MLRTFLARTLLRIVSAPIAVLGRVDKEGQQGCFFCLGCLGSTLALVMIQGFLGFMGLPDVVRGIATVPLWLCGYYACWIGSCFVIQKLVDLRFRIVVWLVGTEAHTGVRAGLPFVLFLRPFDADQSSFSFVRTKKLNEWEELIPLHEADHITSSGRPAHLFASDIAHLEDELFKVLYQQADLVALAGPHELSSKSRIELNDADWELGVSRLFPSSQFVLLFVPPLDQLAESLPKIVSARESPLASETSEYRGFLFEIRLLAKYGLLDKAALLIPGRLDPSSREAIAETLSPLIDMSTYLEHREGQDAETQRHALLAESRPYAMLTDRRPANEEFRRRLESQVDVVFLGDREPDHVVTINHPCELLDHLAVPATTNRIRIGRVWPPTWAAS